MRGLAKIGTALVLFLSATGLRAQTPPPAAVPPAAVTPAPKHLSVADARTKADALEKQIETDTRFVLHLREQAKKKKDVIKLNCVNDRLVRLKAQLNLADEKQARLKDALAANNEERHVFLVSYGEQAQAVRRLREEAVACVGEPELYKQESGTNASEHPPFPDDPGKDEPFEPEVEPPGYASPFS